MITEINKKYFEICAPIWLHYSYSYDEKINTFLCQLLHLLYSNVLHLSSCVVRSCS